MSPQIFLCIVTFMLTSVVGRRVVPKVASVVEPTCPRLDIPTPSPNNSTPTPDQEDAKKERFPYLCTIHECSDPEFACYGILVDTQLVVTASYCIEELNSPVEKLMVRCGSRSTNEDSQTSEVASVIDCLSTKGKDDKEGNTLAFVQLCSEFDFDVPRKLQKTTRIKDGENFSVLFWSTPSLNEADAESKHYTVASTSQEMCEALSQLSVKNTDEFLCTKKNKDILCEDNIGSDVIPSGHKARPIIRFDDEQETGKFDDVFGLEASNSEPCGNDQTEHFILIYKYSDEIEEMKELVRSSDGTPINADDAGFCSRSPPPPPPPPGPAPTPAPETDAPYSIDDCDLDSFEEDCDPPDGSEPSVASVPVPDDPPPPVEPEAPPSSPGTVGCCSEMLLDPEDCFETIINEDSVTRLQSMIEQCPEINVRSYRTMNDRSLLHLAAEADAARISDILVDEGIDLDATDDEQRTALHIAARYNSLDTAKVLVKAGADVNASDDAGRSPLHFAVRFNNEQMLIYLLKNDPNVSAATLQRMTPLHFAAYYDRPSLVPLLIAAGASVTARDNNRNTPLHIACNKGHPQVVKRLLMAKGISCSQKNLYDWTPREAICRPPDCPTSVTREIESLMDDYGC